MAAYYNDSDPFNVEYLKNLIAANIIAPGDVDGRSITDIHQTDLAGYAQCHFFAGAGGWSIALRRAGWPDNRPVWTGSCPCQPFSAAGRREKFSDNRHLWPTWVRLIEKRSPPIVFGEQVAAATEWLRLVRSDLETLGYAVGCAPIEAASAGADHYRDRLWFVADAGRTFSHAIWSEPRSNKQEEIIHDQRRGSSGRSWIECADGKRRPSPHEIPLVAHGLSRNPSALRAIGNAIDIGTAVAFIRAADEAIRACARVD